MKIVSRLPSKITTILGVAAFAAALTAFSVLPGRSMAYAVRSMTAVQDEDKEGFDGTPEDHNVRFFRHANTLDILEDKMKGQRIDSMFSCTHVDCKKPRVRLQLSVTGESKGHRWSDAFAGSKHGRIVAVFKNMDDVPYPHLKLDPGDKGYLWVGRIKGMTGSRPTLYRISSWNPFDQPDALVSFEFKQCTKAESDPQIHINRPPECLPPRKGAPVIPDDAVWISCASGCCEARLDGLSLAP